MLDVEQRLGREGETQKAINFCVQRETDQLVGQWATTSGDDHPGAVAMQSAVMREFGVTDASMGHFDDDVIAEAREILDKDGEGLQAFARAEYDETQAFLTENGIDEVYATRGMKFESNAAAREAGFHVDENDLTATYSEDLSMQPVSSFSTEPMVAGNFARQVAMITRVPKERVLSTCRTGAGCLPEGEITVLGGSGDHGISISDPSYDIDTGLISAGISGSKGIKPGETMKIDRGQALKSMIPTALDLVYKASGSINLSYLIKSGEE